MCKSNPFLRICSWIYPLLQVSIHCNFSAQKRTSNQNRGTSQEQNESKEKEKNNTNNLKEKKKDEDYDESLKKFKFLDRPVATPFFFFLIF